MRDISEELQFYPETLEKNMSLYKRFWTKTMPVAHHSPPDGYILDEYKFRKYNISNCDNAKSIFCFGCEITFGTGFKDEETWPHILSKKLSGNFVPFNYGTIGASLEYNTMCFYQLMQSIPKEKHPEAVFFHVSNPYRVFYIGNNQSLSPLITHINIHVDKQNTIEKMSERDGDVAEKMTNYYSYTSYSHTFFRIVRYFKLINQISVNNNIPWFSYSTNPFFNNLTNSTVNNYLSSNFYYDSMSNGDQETNQKTAEVFKTLYEKHIFRPV